jgi:ferrochelatase
VTHGVLLMAYGSPERAEDVEAYYTDIRRGRPPTPEQVADLRARYDAIGGLSPLAERTRAQASGLQRVLGDDWIVELGLKHASPRVEDGAQRLLDAGVERVIGIVLAPHFSALSIAQYDERARTTLAGRVPYDAVTHWGADPALVELLADRVLDAAARIAEPGRVEVLVTAHSLPVRALELDKPSYPEQLQATADRIAVRAKLPSVRIAWQSAGRTPEPWIGPDILDVIRGLASERFDAVVVCPAGFTSDHLEVLYDVEIEARRVAESVGLQLERTASLNDDEGFLQLLARLARVRARVRT